MSVQLEGCHCCGDGGGGGGGGVAALWSLVSQQGYQTSRAGNVCEVLDEAILLTETYRKLLKIIG